MIGNPIKGRLLMVTRALPVESGGTMIVIKRLLQNFGAEEVVVMGRSPHPSRILKNDQPLHYRTIEIPVPHIKGYWIWRMLSIPVGTVLGLSEVWRNNIKVIAGVYPDIGSVATAYFISIISDKPLLAYFCDLFVQNQRPGFHTGFAKWLQPRIFRRAKKIIVANDGMKTFFLEKYGLDAICLPAAINGDLPEEANIPEISRPFVIGYSGSVVQDRLDPLQALVAAIGNKPEYELRLFTPQTEAYLRQQSIWANNVVRRFCTSQNDLISELTQCHLLYLPLTFKTENGNSVEQLATCFGIKSYEYFQSGRAILSHSPSGYFTLDFFIKNKCGYTLTCNEPNAILKALGEIVVNYRNQTPIFVKNALHAARQFKGERLAKTFTELVDSTLAK